VYYFLNNILTVTEENQIVETQNKTLQNMATTGSEQCRCSIRKSDGSRNKTTPVNNYIL
jgi:hypothetical protein